MTPEQAAFLLNDVYLPQIRGEYKTTCRVIEAIPADQVEYKPDPKAKSAMELAKHLASSEIFFMTGAANGVFNREDAAIPESVKTPVSFRNGMTSTSPRRRRSCNRRQAMTCSRKSTLRFLICLRSAISG